MCFAHVFWTCHASAKPPNLVLRWSLRRPTWYQAVHLCVPQRVISDCDTPKSSGMANSARSVQKNMQALSRLRQQLMRSGGSLLDASGTLSCTLHTSLLDAIIAEVPLATWMAAFLALHGAALLPDVKVPPHPPR